VVGRWGEGRRGGMNPSPSFLIGGLELFRLDARHSSNIECCAAGQKERKIRLMTNSHKSQSEKLAADSKEAAQQKGPRPTPLTGREHVGGGSRGKSPEPTPGPCAGSR
jgi:hypothetical protein